LPPQCIGQRLQGIDRPFDERASHHEAEAGVLANRLALRARPHLRGVQ
jgi:hypothetical protein